MRYIKILPIIGLAAALMSCDKPSRKHEPVKEEERQAVVFEPLNIITGATEFQVDYTHDGKVDVEIQIFYDENGKTIKKVENYLSTKRKEDFIWEYAYQGNGKVKELRYDSNGDGKFDLVLRYDKVGNMYEKIERVSDQKYPRVLKTEYFTDGKGNCEVSQYWDDVHKWSMECESPIKNGNNLDNKLDELETILNENP